MGYTKVPYTEPSVAQLLGELLRLQRLLSWVVTCAAVGDLAILLRVLVPPRGGHLPGACFAVLSVTGMCLVLARRIRVGIQLLEGQIGVLLVPDTRVSGQNA